MSRRVVVLGAGFGGLELSSILSSALGDALDLVLIDRSEWFMFGFSKLDVMFGRQAPAAARHYYRDLVKPGVRFVRATITAIDPGARHVVTDAGEFDADVLVVALGAEYAPEKIPGLVEGGYEFYSVAGVERLRDVLPRFERGAAVVGVTSTPFKCPPAPSEAALLLHDALAERGRRGDTTIHLVMPFGVPVPPSPTTSQALLAAFAERGITYVTDRLVRALDPARKVAMLSDGRELPCDLFLGIPPHKVPTVIEESGLAVDGWIPVDRKTLATTFPGVYAVGDVTSVGTPKAGVFAESAARVVAQALLADWRGRQPPGPYAGAGACYVEFGHGRVGRVDVDFFTGPTPTGTFQAPSLELVAEKKLFGSSRRERWGFGPRSSHAS